MLNEAVKLGWIGSIDGHFARHLAVDDPSRLFVAYLLAATRAGHLCVAVGDSGLDPCPSSMGWEPGPLWEALELGARSLSPDERLVCEEGRWYLARYFRAESLVVDGIRQLMESPAPELFSSDLSDEWLLEKVQLGQLLDEQAAVVREAVKNRLTLVCGGPGTGKSYTATFLLSLFKELAPPSFRIAVAAPTGKAVANLRRSIGHLDQVEIGTLHTLLKLHRSVWELDRIAPLLDADLIVVDETSMIDVALFAHLLRSIKPGARLVLMGDPDQLPPVEAGSLFGDLVQAIPPVRLERCLRAELEQVVTLSKKVKIGNGEGLSLIDLSTSEAVARFGMEQLGPIRPVEQLSSDLLIQFDRFRLLSPIRKGALGVEQINQRMVEIAMAQAKGALIPLPILICRNDARLSLSNGEVGLLLSDLSSALFPMDDPEAPFADSALGVRKIPVALLPSYEYAFCISIHKSQGSEFERVAVLLPEGGEGLNREILYTAVTRAKRKIDLIGSEKSLRAALSTTSRRRSGLVERCGRMLKQLAFGACLQSAT